MKIATRGSALALWQAGHVAARLRAAGVEAELVVIKTQGDKILDVPLAQIGGKGLFVKEIEEALAGGRADLAVHSMKDVPAAIMPGLLLAAVSARADPRDALVGARLDDLRHGARVGTSSVRRTCQLRALRPDLQIISLRGNVDTRLRKLDAGEFDAILLAAAGLARLGHAGRIAEALHPDHFVPAIGQGVLAIETRAADGETIDLARRALHDEAAATCVAVEREFLARLEGGCQTPIACHAVLDGGGVKALGLVGSLDGQTILRASLTGPAAGLGGALADLLLARGAAHLLANLP